MTYTLFLDTPASADAVRTALIEEMDFVASDSWKSEDGVPWLLSGRGSVYVELPAADYTGPCDYPQPATVLIRFYYSKEPGTPEHLARVEGDLLQRFPGDATLQSEGGVAELVRRGDTVWVDPDPFNMEHLFAGSFRPAKLVRGLPPPVSGEDPYADLDDEPHGNAA